MSETAARTAVYNAVDGVADIGNVYDYERWAAFYKNEIELIKATIGGVNFVRFWTVAVSEIAQERAAYGGRRYREYTYKISGAVGLDDAAESEKTAMALAISVMDALDTDTTIHDGNVYVNASLAQLTVSELRQIGTEFCHFIEIEQRIMEYA